MPDAMRGAMILENLPYELAVYTAGKIEEMNAMRQPEDRVDVDACESVTPDFWQAEMQEALDGDAADASAFVFRLPNAFRGWFALGAHHSSVPNPVFRAIMEHVWDHDHHVLMATVRKRRATVRAMMRRAEFDVSGLPEAFPVYRGTSHLPLAKAAQGLAWTTSYEVAAWFAMRGGGSTGPLVLTAQARRSDALFHHHGRGEDEVMLGRDFRPDEVAIIDGPDEWQRRHAAHLVTKAAWKDELMAA